MDIGFGTPYAAMQRSKAPLRIICRLSKLKYFSVTNKKCSELKDLNGEPFPLHSRGGGTDKIANFIEDRLSMKFGESSYMPGSVNRVVALLGGRSDVTLIDLSNKNKLMRSDAGSASNVLEMFDVEASDEALFGNLAELQENEADVQIFVDALISVYRDIHEDPTIIRRETNPDGPIGKLPEEILAELDGLYGDAVEAGQYDRDGGRRKAAQADMEWYSAAGKLEGDASTLNIEDFWYLKPLDAATK